MNRSSDSAVRLRDLFGGDLPELGTEYNTCEYGFRLNWRSLLPPPVNRSSSGDGWDFVFDELIDRNFPIPRDANCANASRLSGARNSS